MEITILIYPSPPNSAVVQTLELAGYDWKAVSSLAGFERANSSMQIGGAIVSLDEDPDSAWALCRAMRKLPTPLEPIILVINDDQLSNLELRESFYDDFVSATFRPQELISRLRHRLWAGGKTLTTQTVDFGSLSVNLETYQALLDGAPLDLTYMEYQLLKFLATHPLKVFSRETLLSRVWGYEYYGGARTVDVHVRRLRSKLGEEQDLIHTVRSVGYMFGPGRDRR